MPTLRKRVDLHVGPAGAAEAALLGVRTNDATDFWLRRERLRFDGVMLERCSGSMREHDPVRRRGRQRDAFDALLVERGSIIRAPEPPVTADEALLAPRAGTGRYLVPAGTSTIGVSVERSLLMQVAPQLPEAPLRVGAAAPFVSAVRAFASTLLDGDAQFSAVEGYAAGQLLAEMVGAMLLNHIGAGRAAGDAAGGLRDRALAAIAQLHVDPSFGPADVAREASVSLRRLQEAFAEAGTTVAGEIRRQRAQSAIGLLSSPRFDALSVDEIAAQVGFGSTLSLRRALTDLHSCTPSKVRSNRGADGAGDARR